MQIVVRRHIVYDRQNFLGVEMHSDERLTIGIGGNHKLTDKLLDILERGMYFDRISLNRIVGVYSLIYV
jgi:hypothetical protein